MAVMSTVPCLVRVQVVPGDECVTYPKTRAPRQAAKVSEGSLTERHIFLGLSMISRPALAGFVHFEFPSDCPIGAFCASSSTPGRVKTPP